MSNSEPILTVPTLFNVAGKKALITGGATGIGLMMSSALVQNGGHVWIASRKEKQLKQTADILNSLPGNGRCDYIVGDVGSKAGCEAIVAELKSRTDTLDILVNNSGTVYGAPFDNVPEREGWDRVLATNVKAIFYLTSGLTPLLEKGKNNLDPGRVINIGSISSLDPKVEDTPMGAPNTGLWSYHTSKAAASHLTSTLALTLASRNITVNSILPGIFPSRLTNWGLEHGNGAKAVLKGQPLGRVGTAEDIAGVFLFLISRGSAHMTGAHIPIDGGSFISQPCYKDHHL